MRRFLHTIAILSLILLGSDCRDPFEPDFVSGLNDYMVVEGYINVGTKAVTKILLSRVTKLEVTAPERETGATVMIENEHNEKFPVKEIDPGQYQTDSLTLDTQTQYRLVIKGSDGKEYASEFIQPLITPKIDTIYWQWRDDGIHIMISTNGSETNTRFYKWVFDETWEIRSDYKSRYYYDSKADTMIKRSSTQINQLFQCWVTRVSNGLRFATSSQFATEQIEYSLINLGHFSEKLKYNYSMFAVQRTMTEEEYNFLVLMQKNTLVTGSLFDPMPGELRGNITCLTDPNLPVVGYIGAYTTETRRFFIKEGEIPIRYPTSSCKGQEVPSDSFYHYFVIEKYIPVDSSRTDVFGTTYFTGAFGYCVDCRIRGTNIRPDFFRD